MPPTAIIPGFQVVARSAGKILVSMLPDGDTTASEPDWIGSATLTAVRSKPATTTVART
jgi:hypothetical protein